MPNLTESIFPMVQLQWTKKLDLNEILMMPSCSNGVFYMPKIIMPEQDNGGGGGGGGGGAAERRRWWRRHVQECRTATSQPSKLPQAKKYGQEKLPAADPNKRDMGDLAYGIPSITPKGIVLSVHDQQDHAL